MGYWQKVSDDLWAGAAAIVVFWLSQLLRSRCIQLMRSPDAKNRCYHKLYLDIVLETMLGICFG